MPPKNARRAKTSFEGFIDLYPRRFFGSTRLSTRTVANINTLHVDAGLFQFCPTGGGVRELPKNKKARPFWEGDPLFLSNTNRYIARFTSTCWGAATLPEMPLTFSFMSSTPGFPFRAEVKLNSYWFCRRRSRSLKYGSNETGLPYPSQ